jgi:purine-binding chemotaxis protein CheW
MRDWSGAERCAAIPLAGEESMLPTALIGSSQAASGPMEDRAGKYLIFRLGSEEFGARVLKVREIMGIQEVTPVPHTPAFVKGVINVRGKVIPVIDLRLKFGLPSEEYTSRTCIIVVRTHLGEDRLMMGIVVDEVAEVVTLAASDIEETPDFGPEIETPYLLGMAKVKDKVKILLDIDQVLNSQELLGLNALMR